MKLEEVFFNTGYTIEAVLRLKNPLVKVGPQLQELVELFNKINNYECTKAYMQYKIPVLDEYQVKEMK